MTDKRVIVYAESWTPPLTQATFDQVASASLYREESFFIDSTIVLELHDGTVIEFPVSSQSEGDVRFHDAIEARLSPSAAPDPVP